VKSVVIDPPRNKGSANKVENEDRPEEDGESGWRLQIQGKDRKEG
jgi:hypothetical protein